MAIEPDPQHFLASEATMPKEEWGTKRVCPETGKRFYDLNADPVVSPYTGNVVPVEAGKTRTMQADAEDAQNKKLKAEDLDDDDLVLDDDDTGAELDDDVLEDDDADEVSLDELADVPASDTDE